MRLTILAIAGGITSFAFAQTLTGLPDCAKPCVLEFTSGSQIAGCNGPDISCVCSNQNFLSQIACCLAGACSVADQQAATSYAQTLCRTNGVTNLPSAVSCASTATPSSTASPSDSTPNTTSGSLTTSSAASSTGNATKNPSTTISGATSSTSSPAATKNVGPQNMACVGAGIAGGLVALMGVLM